MKALLYCYGSRGDVEPFIALASAIRAAGHEAVLAGPAQMHGFAAVHQVPFRPLDDESLRMLDCPEIQEFFLRDDKPNRDTRIAARELMDASMRCYPRFLADVWAAAEDGADIVVHSQAGAEATHQVAERLGVPAALGTLYPNYAPSRRYPSMLLAGVSRYPALLNWLSHQVAMRWPPMAQTRRMADRWRSETLGLQERRGQWNFRFRPGGGATPILHCFSRHLIPPAPDWAPSVHTSGFWQVPEARWTLPAELAAFLAHGPPPVFIGFGSLVGVDPGRVSENVLRALDIAGQRAVVVRAAGGMAPDPCPSNVYLLDEAPYSALFGHVRAVVHAGGAGTVNYGLRAGLPQVPCPFHREQAMWAHRVHEIGVATKPMRVRDLDASTLADAIGRAVTDAAMAERATEVAELVRAETGADGAVEALERIVSVLKKVRLPVGGVTVGREP